MARLNFFFLPAVLMSLQVAQDGVHSCALRNHKMTSAAGPPSACSTPGVLSSAALPHRTPVSCATPTLGLQYPDALNKIPSISPISFLQPNPVPAVTPPPYLTSVSSASGNNRILIDLLLEYFAATELSRRLPSPPSSSSTSLRDSFTPSPRSALLTPVPYPATPNLQNGHIGPEQLLSRLLSVSGPDPEIINPAVPSDRSLPPLPSNTGTLPLVAVPNAIPPAPAPVEVPKSTSSVPETAPAAVSSPPPSPSSFPATMDLDNVPANAAATVPTLDPAILQADFVNASDSTLVTPTSGSAQEPAPVSEAAQATDSVSSASTSAAVVSSTTLPTADTTTPTIV